MPAVALAFFLPGHSAPALTPLDQGNINDTWRVDLDNGASYVLQRLHPTVFTRPDAVMANIRIVTGHLARDTGSDVTFFRLITNAEGQDHLIDEAGCCWRLLTYIPHTRTLTRLENLAQATEIGRLLGRFHLLTADIVPDRLADPLPGFHLTPRYLAQCDVARCQADSLDDQERRCCQWIDELRPYATVLEQARTALSSRVIHGDPKAANFLFAAGEDRAVSLIDFDTVKPGLLLHDLGDCLRSCCNPRGETHVHPFEIEFEPAFFQALLTGYLPQAGHLLNLKDQELLVASALVISLELGLRFFTDHLTGNQYFRITSPGQNLHRALIQLHLCRSIQRQADTLQRMLAGLMSTFAGRERC